MLVELDVPDIDEHLFPFDRIHRYLQLVIQVPQLLGLIHPDHAAVIPVGVEQHYLGFHGFEGRSGGEGRLVVGLLAAACYHSRPVLVAQFQLHSDLGPGQLHELGNLGEFRRAGEGVHGNGDLEPVGVAGVSQKLLGSFQIVTVLRFKVLVPLRVPGRQRGMEGMDFRVPNAALVQLGLEGFPVNGLVEGLANHDSPLARRSDWEVGVIVFGVGVEHAAEAEGRLLGGASAGDDQEAFLGQPVAQVAVDLGHVGLAGAELGQTGGFFQDPGVAHFRINRIMAPVPIREGQRVVHVHFRNAAVVLVGSGAGQVFVVRVGAAFAGDVLSIVEPAVLVALGFAVDHVARGLGSVEQVLRRGLLHVDDDVIGVHNLHIVNVADAALVAGAGTLLAGQLEAVRHVLGGELAEPLMELDALLQFKGPHVSGGVHLPGPCQHGGPLAGVGVQLHQVLYEGAVLVHEVNTTQPRHHGVVDGSDQPQDDFVRQQLLIGHRVRGGRFRGRRLCRCRGLGRRWRGAGLCGLRRCGRLTGIGRRLGGPSASYDKNQRQKRWHA